MPSTKSTKPLTDIYQRVTDAIIAQLEAGVRPWHQPWGAIGTSHRPLRHNAVPYRGINTVLLWMSSNANGFSSPYWMTYRQSQEIGGQVRKGSKSTLVVYAGAIERSEEADNGEEVERRIPFLKGYSVFNCDQIDNLPERFYPAPIVQTPAKERIPHADEFFKNTGSIVKHGGDRAYYMPSGDFIAMPVFEAFESASSYISVLGHEHVHWTMHADRLARDFGSKKWGDDAYALEEAVAETGAAMICADLGIEDHPREDHAAYIASWIKCLKNDKRAIFKAASHAEQAVRFLHGLQPASDQRQNAA
ncbi:MAG: zincin-like metallopeptidase domain-containing protein [Rhizobiaceae bacterium]|nr:zincin-like metallopeptidase domain-containing protein [Rhizobiaceae bacterium]